MSRCPNGIKGRHQERIEGTPNSAMTWYVCAACGARRPRGPGLFYSQKESDMPTNQTPEALAEEILRAASDFAAAKLALYGRQDPSLGNPADLLDDLKFAINRLRDMAVSRGKREPLAHRLFDSQWVNVVNAPEVLNADDAQAAVAAAVKLTEQAMAKNIATDSWPAPKGT